MRVWHYWFSDFTSLKSFGKHLGDDTVKQIKSTKSYVSLLNSGAYPHYSIGNEKIPIFLLLFESADTLFDAKY